MRPVVVGLLAVSVLAGGCSDSAPPDEVPAPVASPAVSSAVSSASPDAAARGGMTITPATARPGQRVALRFTPPVQRGIAFSLATPTEEGWTVAYYLTSDWGTPAVHRPEWWSVDDTEGRGWVDVGIGGPGPDHVVVPDDAPAGDLLLCTANSPDETCAVLTVVP